MPPMTETPDTNDAGLAEQAAQWRRRALQGDKRARGVAHELETEMRRRLGDSVARPVDLDTRPLEARQRARSWWSRWLS